MAPAIGIGVGAAFCRSPTGPDADATALIARMTVAPSTERAKLIDKLVRGLKASGVWQKLDGLYVMAAHDAQAARLNWCGNRLNLTPGGAPIFTVDRGYQGDGASAFLAIEGANTDYARWSLTSASIGVWLNICVPEMRVVAGRTDDYRTQVLPLSAADTLNIQIATVSSYGRYNTVPGYTGLGMTRATREVSTQYFVRTHEAARILRNLPIPTPTAPNGWPQRFLSGVITGGASGMTFSNNRIAVAYYGGALTNAQEVAMDAALKSYLNAVGGA